MSRSNACERDMNIDFATARSLARQVSAARARVDKHTRPAVAFVYGRVANQLICSKPSQCWSARAQKASQTTPDRLIERPSSTTTTATTAAQETFISEAVVCARFFISHQFSISITRTSCHRVVRAAVRIVVAKEEPTQQRARKAETLRAPRKTNTNAAE